MEGTKLKKGERSSIILKPASGASLEEENEEVDPASVDVQKEYREQEELQQETQGVLLQMKAANAVKDTSIETCQEYLQEVRVEVHQCKCSFFGNAYFNCNYSSYCNNAFE